MDVATESIIVVIAHPIAGNPSQFAVERALKAMGLDWRVLSFDVLPEDVPAALDGFAVTGIAGVLIDHSLQAAASDWLRAKTGDGEMDNIDCLYRNLDVPKKANQFAGVFEQRAWLDDQINAALAETDNDTASDEARPRHATKGVWFGESLGGTAVDQRHFQTEPSFLLTDVEFIKNEKLIALARGHDGPVELEQEDWPKNKGSTLVIDLSSESFSGRHPELEAIADLGYRVVSVCDQKVGTLQRCLNRWTGSNASGDVIRDAIEEYLGV